MKVPKKIITALRLDNKHHWKQFPWLKHPTRSYELNSKPIGEGAFSTAYLGYPLDPNGTPDQAFPVVVKIAKLTTLGRTNDKTIKRLELIRRQNANHFVHVNKRLFGCKHANVIIDISSEFVGAHELPVTIQPYLESAVQLDKWIDMMGIRPGKAIRKDGKLINPLPGGIADQTKWAEVALLIALALKDIHLHRVSHADIHPGNIFISLKKPYKTTFIDFCDAFVATPDINSRQRNPNSYLAPERLGSRRSLSEAVDVYSFGVLMLYLATGIERGFSPDDPAFFPGSHGAVIREMICKYNSGLLRGDPRIIDLIARSTARDPLHRPRMSEIVSILQWLLLKGQGAPAWSTNSIKSSLALLNKRVEEKFNHHNPILLKLLEQQVQELSNVVEGLKTEMVELYGTRDHLLRSLVSVFDLLEKGDSWTSATNLALWQHNALGMDGSYFSATISALNRGVSVRRVFIVSVEELGRDFSNNLRGALLASKHAILQELGVCFNRAIKDFDDAQMSATVKYIDLVPKRLHRFKTLLSLIADSITRWNLAVNDDQSVDITTARGLYFGLYPVGTLEQISAIREDNPASLVYFAKEPNPSRKWLLVVTEAKGRHERDQRQDKKSFDEPQLLGMRIFKSVQGDIPTDRVEHMSQLINGCAKNVGGVIFELLKMAEKSYADVCDNKQE